jgi:hypothetical protein
MSHESIVSIAVRHLRFAQEFEPQKSDGSRRQRSQKNGYLRGADDLGVSGEGEISNEDGHGKSDAAKNPGANNVPPM